MSVNNILFDEPGPKARRRILIGTITTLIVFLAILILLLLEFAKKGQLEPERWLQFTDFYVWKFLGEGIWHTVKAATVAMLGVIPAGAILAMGRISERRIIRWLATAYIEAFRSTPMLLLVYIFVGVLPSFGFNPEVFWKLVIPIILGASAIMAEVFRAGILALPKGQSEAASALGLSHGQKMRLVIFPQALKLVIPALITQMVSVLKDTTLGYAASYPELLKSAANLTTYTGYLIQTYLVIALLYVATNFALSKFAHWLEEKLNGPNHPQIKVGGKVVV